MARLTRYEVVSDLAAACGVSRIGIDAFFEAVAALAVAELNEGGEFVLPGIGKFTRHSRAERQGRNPATGAVITIPPGTIVRFRPARAFRDGLAPGPVPPDPLTEFPVEPVTGPDTEYYEPPPAEAEEEPYPDEPMPEGDTDSYGDSTIDPRI